MDYQGYIGRPGRLAIAALLLAAAALVAGCSPMGYPRDPYEPIVSDYQYLSDYGEWIDAAHYGPVWRPYVAGDWSPFYYGHWVWTDDGWAWVSYEPFGMLVYHYGYWDYSLRYGWVWIPDDVWSPARVVWYDLDGYAAWAPMPPPRLRWPDPWDPWDVNVWMIVPYEDFTAENVGTRTLRERGGRDMIASRTAEKRPPSIERIRTTAREPVRRIDIERRRVPIEKEVIQTHKRTLRRVDRPIRKMVLPEREKEKINRHSGEVERRVLRDDEEERRRRSSQPERERKRPEPRKEERREKDRKQRKRTDRDRG